MADRLPSLTSALSLPDLPLSTLTSALTSLFLPHPPATGLGSASAPSRDLRWARAADPSAHAPRTEGGCAAASAGFLRRLGAFLLSRSEVAGRASVQTKMLNYSIKFDTSTVVLIELLIASETKSKFLRGTFQACHQPLSPESVCSFRVLTGTCAVETLQPLLPRLPRQLASSGFYQRDTTEKQADGGRGRETPLFSIVSVSLQQQQSPVEECL
ncbi:uncharacterized protein [Delphinus delphis]|uniref:uncharacterized protein n=1 Tax=Delphinus delphis TaxID=9728 RepID=UPI003752DF6E